MEVGDSFITIETEIGHHIVSFFETLFKADNSLSTDYSFLDSLDWKKASDEQNLLLTSIPSDEIREAVLGLDALSALGPDGFGGHFYHNCWTLSRRM